jgi:hypothetical protein
MSSPFTFEYFDQKERDAAEQFDKAQLRAAEGRTKFFERLALLNAGAVVLSVSLLSNFFWQDNDSWHSVPVRWLVSLGFVPHGSPIQRIGTSVVHV